MPAPVRTLLNKVLMPIVFPRLGLSHPVDTGPDDWSTPPWRNQLHSGAFYASAADTLTGPLVDQAGIVADFAAPEIQSNAAEAIHRYAA